MAKRFKLKIARVLSKSFQSCRSKHPSFLPENPLPLSSPNLTTDTLLPLPAQTTSQPTPPPSVKPHRSSLKRHVSSTFTYIGCGLRSLSSPQCLSETDNSQPPPPPTPQFHWEKHAPCHVIANGYEEAQTPRRKVYSSLVSRETSHDDLSRPLPQPPPGADKMKRPSTKKKTPAKTRISTSSADSVLFSSETFDDIDDEETETLVSSSRSFSTDSSEFIVGTRRSKKSKRPKGKAPKRCCGTNGKRRSWSSAKSTSSPEESPARLSIFLQRMIPCTVEGKIRESFAVVKRSEEPYMDFKRSMMEMVLEKEMFEEKDLEQLLQCFLSLNSRQHHADIVRAFSDIWEALFCASTATALGRRSSSSSSSFHGFSRNISKHFN